MGERRDDDREWWLPLCRPVEWAGVPGVAALRCGDFWETAEDEAGEDDDGVGLREEDGVEALEWCDGAGWESADLLDECCEWELACGFDGAEEYSVEWWLSSKSSS